MSNDQGSSRLSPEFNTIKFSQELDELQNCVYKLFDLNVDLNKFNEIFHGITNLSNYSCTSTETMVLSKGLKYCPTPPKFDHGPLKEDIDRFFRSINLYLFFESNNDNLDNTRSLHCDGFDHKDLHLPSTFNPTMPTNLALVYNKCLEFILESNAVSRNRNLKNVEYKALQSLSDNNEIVIKKADKGSNIVIMNKSDYINEGLNQLSNEKFYKKLKTNPTSSYRERIHLILKHM